MEMKGVLTLPRKDEFWFDTAVALARGQTITEKDAWLCGYDSEMNGVNERNFHFSLFAKPELTKAWEQGKKSAKWELEHKDEILAEKGDKQILDMIKDAKEGRNKKWKEKGYPRGTILPKGYKKTYKSASVIEEKGGNEDGE